MTRASPRQIATFAALLSTMSISAIGFGIAIPLLPSYARAFDIQAWQVGLIFSIFSVGQAAGEALWGRLSDHFGRKPVLLTTLTLSVIGYVAMAYAPNFALCLIARLICGLAAGSGGVVQALVLDISPMQRRTANLALLGACASVGFVVGPAVGGLLARPELGLVGFRGIFLLAAGLSFAANMVIVFGVPRLTLPARLVSTTGEARFRMPANAIGLMLVGVGVMGAFAGVESVFGLWTERRFDWSPRELGLAFALAGCAGAAVQLLVTAKAVRRFGDRRVLIFGLCATACALMCQAFVPIGGMMTGMIALASLGLSLALPTSASLLSQEAPPGTAGRVMGANMAAAALARILGPLFAGALYGLVSPRAPFIVGSLMVLSTVLLARAHRSRTAEAGDPVVP